MEKEKDKDVVNNNSNKTNTIKETNKSNVINKFSIIFNNNYALTDKILNHYIDKGYNDKQIFKLFHTYYWKNIKQEPNKQKEAEFRAINKSKELKSEFNDFVLSFASVISQNDFEFVSVLSLPDQKKDKNDDPQPIGSWR